MDSLRTVPASTSLAALIDQDIAHITRVMWPALRGDPGGPILPVDYWRKRLYRLLDAGHVSSTQLCAIDSLLLQLNHFDTSDSLPGGDTPLPPASGRLPDSRTHI